MYVDEQTNKDGESFNRLFWEWMETFGRDAMNALMIPREVMGHVQTYP